jgi:glycyl-tRNA synthetase alpha subunit
MQIKKDYVRMERRPIDGQAMLEFPERLQDLFDVKDILDPERPAKDW